MNRITSGKIVLTYLPERGVNLPITIPRKTIPFVDCSLKLLGLFSRISFRFAFGAGTPDLAETRPGIPYSPISFPSGFGAHVEISITVFGVSLEGEVCPFNARRRRAALDRGRSTSGALPHARVASAILLRKSSSSSSHARCRYYSSRTMTAMRCHSSEPLPSWHISCTFPSLTTACNRDRRPSL